MAMTDGSTTHTYLSRLDDSYALFSGRSVQSLDLLLSTP